MKSSRTVLLPAFAALLLTAGTAAAQVTGGIAFPPGPIPGAAMAQAFAQTPRLPVSVNPTPRGAPPGAMVTNPSVRRSSVNQQAITRIRGDAGYLAGFNKGQPLAASRQPPVQPVDPSFTIIDAPFIVNNFNSALNFAFGDGNISQQQLGDGTAAGSAGPVETAAPAPEPAPAPTAKPAGPSTLDLLMSTAGPLPHLPAALANGGVQFNNVNTTTNTAVGKGNRATQTTVTVQR
ncbi:hypothetical protein GBZ48_01815 [Azospirillum melinis]|uniref:Uncharacterized protein n=1 Tax=Azospirillum melinis TaxID=328839 RepID=A0ABX2KDZ0_9PROT|nr:hypothetical protein [Azospirillum melinis]MBP2306629.1 hypothetical protein [Azospirillum melinis]NUA98013.1 hypothetical protein [Azospirillum melinis]